MRLGIIPRFFNTWNEIVVMKYIIYSSVNTLLYLIEYFCTFINISFAYKK